MTSHHELWDGVLRRLGSDLPAFALEAWLRPLAPVADGDHLRLLCPTPFHLERVRERFLERISGLLTELAGRELAVSLAVSKAAAPGPALPPREIPAAASVASAPSPQPAQRALPYTFDSFVVGPCNALAREASWAHAGSRGSNERVETTTL